MHKVFDKFEVPCNQSQLRCMVKDNFQLYRKRYVKVFLKIKNSKIVKQSKLILKYKLVQPKSQKEKIYKILFYIK